MGGPDKPRYLDIDRAKGLAIALVVWGHLFKPGSFNQPDWMGVSRDVIYEFHMPFFMYLSGFVFFHSQAHLKMLAQPRANFAKRFDRLMIPFIASAIVIVLGKYLAGRFARVDDSIDSLSVGFLKVVTNAPDNPVLSIWYLLVLFIYSITVPYLWRLGRRTLLIPLAVGLIAFFLPLPEEAFYIRRILVFVLFFAIGGLTAEHQRTVLPLFRIAAPLTVPLLLLVSGLFYAWQLHHPLLICGLLSIPALHGLFLWRFWRGDRLFLLLGRNSMVIYLLNTILIGVAKVAYPRLLHGHIGPFWLFAVIVFTIGCFGPILIRRIIDAIRPLRPIARYLQ